MSILKTEDEFDRLQDAWTALVERSGCTIFQTFEWQRAWWKYFGKGRRLNIIVIEREGRVIGIAPMIRERVGFFGIKIMSALKFAGSDISDYIDVIAEPDDLPEILKYLVEYIKSTEKTWDFFEMRDVSERYQTRDLLRRYLEEAGLKVFTYKGNVCPEVQLPATWENFLLHISGNVRYQLKKKSDRLKKAFPVELELIKDGDDAVENAVREFASIHGARWEGLGYKNAFKDANHLAFHVEVAQMFARRGWLRMFFLKVGRSRVAVNFDFNFHDRIYFYQGNANGSEEVMKYSPGFLLRCAAIEEGIAEGMKTYDMLRGDEIYKTNDFKCVPVGNWQIRAVPEGKLKQLKFHLFILYELLGRGTKRLVREYQDMRRYSMDKNPSVVSVLTYSGRRILDLLKDGRYFLSRFLWRGKRESH